MIVSARSRAIVVSIGYDDEIRPSLGSTSLSNRVCLFMYLGRYFKLDGLGFGGQSATRESCVLRTQVWGFGTHRYLGQNNDVFTKCDG